MDKLMPFKDYILSPDERNRRLGFFLLLAQRKEEVDLFDWLFDAGKNEIINAGDTDLKKPEIHFGFHTSFRIKNQLAGVSYNSIIFKTKSKKWFLDSIFRVCCGHLGSKWSFDYSFRTDTTHKNYHHLINNVRIGKHRDILKRKSEEYIKVLKEEFIKDLFHQESLYFN